MQVCMYIMVTGFALNVAFFLHGSILLLFGALIPNIAFVFKYFDILRAPKPIKDFHFHQFSALQRCSSLGKLVVASIMQS